MSSIKKITYIATLAALTIAATVSCSREFENEIMPGEVQGITLEFFSQSLATKATVDGVDNENRVDEIQFYIFPTQADTVNKDAKAVITGKYSSTSTDGWTVTGDGASKTWKYSLTTTKEQTQSLFSGGGAKVFAVANYNGETALTTTMTWKTLHELEVSESFLKDGGVGFGMRWPRPMATDSTALFFVMTSEQDLVLNKTDWKASATCPLERLASKVTVTYNFPTEIAETLQSGEIIYWRPQPTGSETRTYLSNAILKTTLGGPLTRKLVTDSGSTFADGSRDMFEYAYDFLNSFAEGELPYYYTYPISMEEGDDNQPYLKLVLPWYGYKKYGSDEVLYKQKEVYYKIVLPSNSITEANRIYEYTVDVNIIGSDKEVKIVGEEYVVKDWSSGDPVSSNLATGRYISLEIPKDEYDMYVDELDLNFVSSGTVIAQIDSIYQVNLSEATPSKDMFMLNDVVTATTALKNRKGITNNEEIQGWVTIPENTSYVKINHEMDNQMLNGTTANQAFDMTPYVFVVTLHLEEAGDDTSFDRTITITQYPAIYIINKESNGYAFVNAYGGGQDCYDNGRQNRMGDLAYEPGDCTGTGDNDNPNNYIVTASIVPDETYVIGDPRSHTVDNLANLDLTNYKPALSSGTQTFIAPKLIVASSYGALNSTKRMSYENAQKRCASYQENGYPAGRWRVPTYAEVKFMTVLSNAGFIPELFNPTGTYWCANGQLIFNGNNVTYNAVFTGQRAPRCVYDAWYWGEDPVYTGTEATTWQGFHD